MTDIEALIAATRREFRAGGGRDLMLSSLADALEAEHARAKAAESERDRLRQAIEEALSFVNNVGGSRILRAALKGED